MTFRSTFQLYQETTGFKQGFSHWHSRRNLEGFSAVPGFDAIVSPDAELQASLRSHAFSVSRKVPHCVGLGSRPEPPDPHLLETADASAENK